jgi:hypothetical protein
VAAAQIYTRLKAVSGDAVDSEIIFANRQGNATKTALKLGHTAVAINDSETTLDFRVKTDSTTQTQSFFRGYNNTDIAERYTEVLRGSKTITSTPVNVTANRCYGSNIVTDTGASVLNLPEAVPGMHLQVVNKNIAGISVAPASGNTINGSTGSYSVSHNWTIAKFICIADGEWVVGEAN